MELDKQTIKSISSDTRVEILKSLAKRRKMPSELSKQLKLAPSTVAEHLKILENSSLIKRNETGHKWIYYELSEKGKALVAPQYNSQFVVDLVLGSILILGGFAGYFTPYWHAEPIPQFGFLDDAGVQYSLKSSNDTVHQETVDVLDIKPEIQVPSNRETKNSTMSDIEPASLETTANISERITQEQPTNIYAILILAGAVIITLSITAPRKYILEVT